jgi:TolB-like protein/Tfp pilus assembly protein PilF
MTFLSDYHEQNGDNKTIQYWRQTEVIDTEAGNIYTKQKTGEKMKDLGILESWKEIADYLKKAERTCRRWEKDFNLPVHRMDGSPKARVFAYKHELDQWIQEMLHKTDESGKREISFKGLNKTLSFTFLSLALCLIGVIIWAVFFEGPDFSFLNFITGRAPLIDTIAVLPLENLSGEEQEYFTEGMHDALITELSKIGALKVIARPSVMRFKNSDQSLIEIAKELNVKGLIAGSTLQEEGKVRITIQLIDAETEQNLWAEKYEKDYRDILKLHSQVAQDIARQIKIKLTPEEKERFAQKREVDPEAYKAFLIGYHHERKLSGQDIKKSIEYFKQAIELDPNFALAYASIARAYAYRTVFTATEPEKAFAEAKAAALKALAIDDSLPEAHLSLGWVLATYDWDWTGAEREFKRAIELNPGFGSVGHKTYGWFLAWMGRFDKAVEVIERGRELNPLSLEKNRVLGVVLYCSRMYDEAIQEQKRVLEMDPYFSIVHVDLGNSYAQKGMYKEAIAEIKEAIVLSNGSYGRKNLGLVYAASGNRVEAMKILEVLKEESKNAYVSPLSIAQLCVGLGLKEEAFEWLETAYKIRDGNLCLLKVWPIWDPLRSDPRFQDLLRRLNFPEQNGL